MANQNSADCDLTSRDIIVEDAGAGRVAVGHNVLPSATGTGNTAVGNTACENLSTASDCTAMGNEALRANQAGGQNTGVGRRALRSINGGTFSTAVGSNALRFATGSLNTCVGALGADAITSGFENTGVGYATLGAITTGFDNTAVGAYSGSSYATNESNNICIGHNVTGTVGDSDTVRIGNGISKTFVEGIRGTTTDTADALTVVIDSNGQLGTGGAVQTSVNASYGQLYEDTPAGTTITIAASPTYTGWVSATSGELSGAGFVTADTASATADNLIIGTSGAGRYLVNAEISFAGDANTEVFYAVFKNGTRQVAIAGKRKIGAGGDVGSASCCGLVNLASTDTIDLRFATDAGTPDIEIINCQLSINRIGS